MKRTLIVVLGLVAAALAYLTLWPVPIAPVAWQPPQDKGYTGAFERNDRLKALEFADLQGETGPEDAAVGPGRRGLCADPFGPKFSKSILLRARRKSSRHPAAGCLASSSPTRANFTRRMPIGGCSGSEPTARSRCSPTRRWTGSPIVYANDLDIAADGVVYFSDASTKFGAKASGGTLPAALLDLMEHGPNGRVLKYDPETQEATVLLAGRSYANGIALAADGSYLLVAETGTYSILKHWLEGSRAGETETLIANLPGFPDNINDNPDGTFWTGLVSPRSPVVDALAGSPFLRKVIMRLPAAIRPGPQRYGFAIRFDGDGNILENLQDPAGDYASVTGAVGAKTEPWCSPA